MNKKDKTELVNLLLDIITFILLVQLCVILVFGG